MVFLSPGKSYVFLRDFEKAILEILMYLVHIASPGKFTCVLVPFLVLLEKKWCVLIKGLCLLLENSYVFLLHPSLLENLMCSRNLFKKVTPGKKRTDILSK